MNFGLGTGKSVPPARATPRQVGGLRLRGCGAIPGLRAFGAWLIIAEEWLHIAEQWLRMLDSRHVAKKLQADQVSSKPASLRLALRPCLPADGRIIPLIAKLHRQLFASIN